MIKITSAGANKLIRTLEDEKSYILSIENNSKTYIRGEGEEAEIPQYDYEETSKKLNEIDEKVCKIKHAINVFNSTTYLPQLHITIDTALVKMAQLNIRKSILDNMRKHLPKVRITDFMGRMNRGVEYEFVNYDLDKVNNDYKEICEQIIEIQLALDTCNQTITFEIKW
ncbi:hypothetical protein GCM10023142_38370 [Anaerocolumna aminovalerica]|uniref:Uncharacterized protein n=1 Tax=Anaerocolumna aminovalerica TaxID=1527 RepID=A0A1I5D1D4_9FIRM|nr:hypothetical protein [Anaerocolumna aminovalerica]SFN92691.1 hypothetical protein SAMN04489757_104163 [Anaerocolumna aminovalerica]